MMLVNGHISPTLTFLRFMKRLDFRVFISLNATFGDCGGDEHFGWKTSLGWCVVGAACADINETDRFGATHTV